MFKEEDPVIIKLSKQKAKVVEVKANRFDKTPIIVVELLEGPWKGETMNFDEKKLEAAA